MLNVLYVFGGEKASGAEKVIERLVNANSYIVNAHLFISPGTFAERLLNEPQQSFKKINVHHELKKLNRSRVNKSEFYLLALRNYISISYKALHYIHKNKIHTVHANTIVPASYLLPAIWISRLFNSKINWIWSDHDLKYFSGFDHILSALCVQSFDKTLVVSEAVKNKFKNECSKVLVLYNGLDLNLFTDSPILRKKFRDKRNINSEQIVIGLAGTMEPRKGQLALIRSFIKINIKFPETLLLLAGAESEDHPEYVQQVLKEVNKNENILYLGKITDMHSYYNGCDLLVNNSSTEGSEPLGTTIYEAMACQRIVIASNTGGSPEIIENAINGYLIEPDSDHDLCETLEKILTNYKSQTKIILNARLKVKERFNIELMMEKYNKLLEF